jgi:hypothetical protein
MKNIHQPILFIVVFALAITFSFCKKEFSFTKNAGDKLEFSTDTLHFDTVFTQLGSATRILKIYNKSKKWLRVSKIFLEKGSDSKFQINVDGLPGRSFENLEIAPKDSLYIFAEVTINPDEPISSSPFILDENLVFETNGNTQKVILEAWGQNANYIPSRFSADSLTLFTCQFDTWLWDDPKPYVIWGGVFVDECELKIPAGARVYFHGGLATQNDILYNDGFLFIQQNGKLTVEGTKSQPVLFASDRIEAEFSDAPGQWAGIRIGYGSTGNRIEYATVKNSIIGIRVDSAAELSLKNTQIYNTASTGLLGIHCTISAENCLFYNNSGFCTQLEFGGNYNFDYCTMTTFGVAADALRFGNTLCRDETCTNFDLFKLKARFRNCIFMGNRADQIGLFDRSASPELDFDYQFENCILRVKDVLRPNQFPDFLTNHCVDCLNAKPTDSLFVNYNDNDFHLDSLSIANGKGLPLPNILIDLEDKMRDATNPDLGCFER